jgi:uncharacterized membrane protein (UPF0182 family)
LDLCLDFWRSYPIHLSGKVLFIQDREREMSDWKRRVAILGIAIVGLGIVLLGLSFLSADYLVDIWWFESLGYLFYYWQRLLYRYLVFAAVTVLFFLIFFLNFWVASRFLGTTTPPNLEKKSSALKAYQDLFKMFRTGSLWIYSPVSLILAIVIAHPLMQQWEAFLLYVFGPGMGIQDPVYGKDISYYLFSYPIYTLLQRRLLIAFLLLFVGMVFLYWMENRILVKQDRRIPKGAKWHLSLLILLVFLIEVWDYALQRYTLLYSTDHLPLFFGPGFVEMRIVLPFIWLSLILLMGTAFSLIFAIHNRKFTRLFALFGLLFVVALGARYSTFLPQTVEKYIVKPNEIDREKPFIANNIRATLDAYNLTDVETRDFNPERVPIDIDAPNIQTGLRNIPVWDGELLEAVFEQLQQLRTYYDFSGVNVDRYTVNGVYQQVFLAARELSQKQLPAGARNWINEHLSYTHGYGAVMTPASQGGNEPMTWFLQGIPPESQYGFTIEQPGIYFGLEASNYVIAPNDAGEIDYPKGNTNVMADYQGKDGVPVSSLFRKLLFASYFGDRNVFFTTRTNAKSKILFRQNIIERIQTLTPYLRLDKTPYLVVTPKRLYWIQDAYTVSDWYPNATPSAAEKGALNYIRNSVKVVVDAYNGTVDYYIFDPKDPIIRAYSRIYPGVFKDAQQMPPELRPHVRYPQDLFEIQMGIYAKYQQTDPEVFYQQEDMWEFAKTFSGNQAVGIKPYYLTLDLIDSKRFDFLLLVPMSPKGRDNLRALAIVGCDPPHYGKIIVYNFPKGKLVYGPSQIYALINQDTKISEQFTLWDQVGSQVGRGRMIILPVGKVMLYIQPIYLQSTTQLKIPELKRLIMSQGEIVVMESSLEEAYTKLQERIKSDAERIDKRFLPLLPGASP